jgi:hypothetical protein
LLKKKKKRKKKKEKEKKKKENFFEICKQNLTVQLPLQRKLVAVQFSSMKFNLFCSGNPYLPILPSDMEQGSN